MSRVYLDHNATSPLRPEVRKAMLEAWDLDGNPSSVHSEGQAARGAIEVARDQVAALVGGNASSVIFTSGATEANMLALTPDMLQRYESAPASHLYCSAVEHPSVQSGGRFSEGQKTEIAVHPDGTIDLGALETALQSHDQTTGYAYVSVMAVNSETGVIQPIEQVAQLARRCDAYCHIDAVQAAGRISLDMEKIGCTSLSLSAHKLGGPKGVGALIMGEEGLEPAPLILGGPQENRVRAGTENVAGIVGFGVAADRANAALVAEIERLAVLRDRFEAGLLEMAPNAVIFGKTAERAGNCCQFALPGTRAETVLIQLDLAGVAVSSGSACSSGKVASSHVLRAMGYDATLAGAAIRVSLGWSNSEEDIEALLAQLGKICAKNSIKVNSTIVNP